MAINASFVFWCKERQADLLTRIRPLQDGSMRMGRRDSDGPWVDTTADEIARLKKDLASIGRALAEHMARDGASSAQSDAVPHLGMASYARRLIA
jgi:hypothetical protein